MHECTYCYDLGFVWTGKGYTFCLKCELGMSRFREITEEE